MLPGHCDGILQIKEEKLSRVTFLIKVGKLVSSRPTLCPDCLTLSPIFYTLSSADMCLFYSINNQNGLGTADE